MGVDRRPEVRVLLIDPQVHFQLAGGFSGSLQNGSRQIGFDQHILRHEAFGYPGGGGPEGTGADQNAHIAVVGGHKAPLIEPPPRLQKQGFGLSVRGVGAH